MSKIINKYFNKQICTTIRCKSLITSIANQNTNKHLKVNYEKNHVKKIKLEYKIPLTQNKISPAVAEYHNFPGTEREVYA